MHCLHTQTQLLTDSNVLSSRGEIFFLNFILPFHCHYYHYCYSHYCVLSFKSLTILSLQEKKPIYLEFYEKKRKYEYPLFLIRKALKVYVVSSGHITMYRCDLILCKTL